MTNLNNKVAVVFAASGAIAGAVAKSFAHHEAEVYITGRDLNAVNTLSDEINQNGGWAEV